MTIQLLLLPARFDWRTACRERAKNEEGGKDVKSALRPVAHYRNEVAQFLIAGLALRTCAAFIYPFRMVSPDELESADLG